MTRAGRASAGTPYHESPMDGGKGKDVLLALSGGVDSVVAVHLLRQAGYSVAGCVIRFSPLHDTAVAAAKRAADELGIPLHVAACEALFEEAVVDPFCRAYAAGRTPNPCVFCNPLVKFRVLAQTADCLGIHYLATGHYARMVQKDRLFYVARAASTGRDQSYMLYRLSQEVLSRLLLPIGGLDKPEIRRIAEALGLSSAGTPDSQDICFIQGRDYAAFVEARTGPSKQGRFIGPSGQDLGPHKGVARYTVGQRKGLGLALSRPVFVRSIGQDGQVSLAWDSDLFAQQVTLEQVVSTNGQPLQQLEGLQVKIRSVARPVPCRVASHTGERARLCFAAPQRAPAPGQHAVLYQGELVVGGGVIDTVYYPNVDTEDTDEA